MKVPPQLYRDELMMQGVDNACALVWICYYVIHVTFDYKESLHHARRRVRACWELVFVTESPSVTKTDSQQREFVSFTLLQVAVGTGTKMFILERMCSMSTKKSETEVKKEEPWTSFTSLSAENTGSPRTPLLGDEDDGWIDPKFIAQQREEKVSDHDRLAHPFID